MPATDPIRAPSLPVLVPPSQRSGAMRAAIKAIATALVVAMTATTARALQIVEASDVVMAARGDLVVLDAPSHVHLAYRPGVPLVRNVVRGGVVAV